MKKQLHRFLPKKRLRKISNSVLRPFGYTVSQEIMLPSPSHLFRLLKRYKMWPKTVFDVGVARGTPWLYEGIPDAKYHLIDPLRESLPYMKKLAHELNAETHNVALGDSKKSSEILVRADIGGSTLFEDSSDVEIQTRYSVPVVRFDDLFNDFERPALCKIDVQGSELSVIRGMSSCIRTIDVLIIETSLIVTLEGNASSFTEVFSELTKEGFVLYDIVGLNRRPLDGALAQIDVVFIREDSPMLSDRRWA